MLIILYEGVKFFNLFRRYKQEQIDEIQAEKDKIQAEKQENARMLEELIALKAQLQKEQNVTATTEATLNTEECN